MATINESDYMDLIGSKSPEKVNEIKIKHKPKSGKLYQYRALETAEQLVWLEDFINTKEIYCNAASNLNDPFDSKSILSEDSDFRCYLEDDGTVPKRYIDKIKSLPILPPDGIPVGTGFDDNDTYNQDVKDAFDEFRETFKLHYTLKDGTMRKVYNKLSEQFKVLNGGLNELSKVTYIASFSEEYDNIPMWTHYTNGHKGVCLEFDMSDFSDEIHKGIYPVRYVKTLPDMVSFLFSLLKEDKNVSAELLSRYCIFQKLKSWEYENEWRFVVRTLLEGSRDPKHKMITHDRIFLTIKEGTSRGIIPAGHHARFVLPSKIIMGCYIPKDIAEFIYALGEREGIAVVKMEITSMGLKEKDFKKT